MRIDEGTATPGKVYWTVAVDPNELVVESGKRLPYGTWIGTISQEGKIRLWTPAASTPRGYPKAAKRLLAEALRQLKTRGLIIDARGQKRKDVAFRKLVAAWKRQYRNRKMDPITLNTITDAIHSAGTALLTAGGTDEDVNRAMNEAAAATGGYRRLTP